MPVLNPPTTFKTLVGTVVNAGSRARTIRVRVDEMKWNQKVQKYYMEPYYLLVRDTNRSCEEGDVINVRSGWRSSKHVKHILTKIITPFGTPISKRPPVAPIETLQKEYEEWRFAKDLRQAARGRDASAQRLLEYPASKVYDSLVDINTIKRRKLIHAWRRTTSHFPESISSPAAQQQIMEAIEDPSLKAEVKVLLKEMKPQVKQILEDASDETPTQKKDPINDRLVRQSRNLVQLDKLQKLLGQVRGILEPSGLKAKSASRSILQSNLPNIQEAFRNSFLTRTAEKDGSRTESSASSA